MNTIQSHYTPPSPSATAKDSSNTVSAESILSNFPLSYLDNTAIADKIFEIYKTAPTATVSTSDIKHLTQKLDNERKIEYFTQIQSTDLKKTLEIENIPGVVTMGLEASDMETLKADIKAASEVSDQVIIPLSLQNGETATLVINTQDKEVQYFDPSGKSIQTVDQKISGLFETPRDLVLELLEAKIIDNTCSISSNKTPSGKLSSALKFILNFLNILVSQTTASDSPNLTIESLQHSDFIKAGTVNHAMKNEKFFNNFKKDKTQDDIDAAIKVDITRANYTVDGVAIDGDTPEKKLENLKDAIKKHLIYANDKNPDETMKNITSSFDQQCLSALQQQLIPTFDDLKCYTGSNKGEQYKTKHNIDTKKQVIEHSNGLDIKYLHPDHDELTLGFIGVSIKTDLINGTTTEKTVMAKPNNNNIELVFLTQ